MSAEGKYDVGAGDPTLTHGDIHQEEGSAI